MNKTIYMTYKKSVPDLVFTRWQNLNKEYNIEFSLDDDCISFIESNFNNYLVELFKEIPIGMYKADLWRLCKLYINGGVYADVDLIPHININDLDKDITFYSCLSKDTGSIFQAFMVNFSKPKNPLILHFLMSFLLNKPYMFHNGPTYDMYNCIKYNLSGINIFPEKKYKLDEIKIPINIGSSKTNTKHINLYYFPDDIHYNVKLIMCPYKDLFNFNFNIINNILTITLIDKNTGWDYDYMCNICIKSEESIFLFKENTGENNNWVTSYITLNNRKILDSRDLIYYNKGGW
jgi:hypothetical protein